MFWFLLQVHLTSVMAVTWVCICATTVSSDSDVQCCFCSVFFENKYELDALTANTVNRYESKSTLPQ